MIIIIGGVNNVDDDNDNQWQWWPLSALKNDLADGRNYLIFKIILIATDWNF